jgi:endonuclease/exonuclease/phosphatase family metal-dependent hydrolase
MIHIINVLWLILLIYIPLDSIEDEGVIKLMTYNIRLDHAGDGADNWNFRKRELVQFLIDEDADFIGIQEGLWHQVQYMDSMMNEYEYIGVGRDDGKEEGEMMAIFYRYEDWTLKNYDTYWLSDQPEIPSRGWDAACNRTLTHGVFTNKKSNKEISITNTHLDHVGKEARKNSITQLGDHLQTIEKNIPIVLMGDFNFTPDDALYQQTIHFIEDCYSVSDTVFSDHPGTFNGFRVDPPYERRIDYIFADVEHLTILNHKTMTPMSINGRHLSDHFPVVVECSIKSLKK